MGLRKMGLARAAAQTAPYAPMTNALAGAARARNRPALAASRIVPNPYAQISRKGSDAENGSIIGAKLPYTKLSAARPATELPYKARPNPNARMLRSATAKRSPRKQAGKHSNKQWCRHGQV